MPALVFMGIVNAQKNVVVEFVPIMQRAVPPARQEYLHVLQIKIPTHRIREIVAVSMTTMVKMVRQSSLGAVTDSNVQVTQRSPPKATTKL